MGFEYPSREVRLLVIFPVFDAVETQPRCVLACVVVPDHAGCVAGSLERLWQRAKMPVHVKAAIDLSEDTGGVG